MVSAIISNLQVYSIDLLPCEYMTYAKNIVTTKKVSTNYEKTFLNKHIF